MDLPLQALNVTFLGCATFSDVLSTYKLARSMLGEILSGNFLSFSVIPPRSPIFRFVWASCTVLWFISVRLNDQNQIKMSKCSWSHESYSNNLMLFTAFEFLDDFCMNLVETKLGLHNPISKQPFYVLIETSGSNSSHDEEVSLKMS